MNTITIRDRTHQLGEVILSVERLSDAAPGLEFSLFADSDDLRQAGFAINCMVLPGAERIAGAAFERADTAGDSLNELGESVICEPGSVLELNSVRVAFGTLRGGSVEARLEAVCRKPGVENNIPVLGVFAARLAEPNRRSDPDQLLLPL